MAMVACLGEIEKGQSLGISLSSQTPRPGSNSCCAARQKPASRWALMLTHGRPTLVKAIIETSCVNFPTRKGSYVSRQSPGSDGAVISSNTIHRGGKPSSHDTRPRRRKWVHGPATRRDYSEKCHLTRNYSKAIPSEEPDTSQERLCGLGPNEFLEPGTYTPELEVQGTPDQMEIISLDLTKDLSVHLKSGALTGQDLYSGTRSGSSTGDNLPQLDQEPGTSSLNDIQKKFASLAIVDQRELCCDDGCNTSDEQRYKSGETLPIPDVELSDDGEVDDDMYWEWDQQRQQFRHWDDEDKEWVYCPDVFD
ncbi:hypothetical protein B0J13DRAFT_250411 [Dactylonectria estremocensis]|uniref:Uncharacterized protein n=1 Tax=Dactylonectria estremocensis TaxID=1079267 RepID=A0A9P9F2Y6_9HYPO|nr:hypothetical protein B0J13DRAFT_250411 [Dactylonectria estremocensis]